MFDIALGSVCLSLLRYSHVLPGYLGGHQRYSSCVPEHGNYDHLIQYSIGDGVAIRYNRAYVLAFGVVIFLLVYTPLKFKPHTVI